MAQIVKMKEYVLKQIDVVLDFIKENTARMNGDDQQVFKAKGGTESNDVVITSQVEGVDDIVTEDYIQGKWDNI